MSIDIETALIEMEQAKESVHASIARIFNGINTEMEGDLVTLDWVFREKTSHSVAAIWFINNARKMSGLQPLSNQMIDLVTVVEFTQADISDALGEEAILRGPQAQLQFFDALMHNVLGDGEFNPYFSDTLIEENIQLIEWTSIIDNLAKKARHLHKQVDLYPKVKDILIYRIQQYFLMIAEKHSDYSQEYQEVYTFCNYLKEESTDSTPTIHSSLAKQYSFEKFMKGDSITFLTMISLLESNIGPEDIRTVLQRVLLAFEHVGLFNVTLDDSLDIAEDEGNGDRNFFKILDNEMTSRKFGEEIIKKIYEDFETATNNLSDAHRSVILPLRKIVQSMLIYYRYRGEEQGLDDAVAYMDKLLVYAVNQVAC